MLSLVTYKILINLRRVCQEIAYSAFRRSDQYSRTPAQILYSHIVVSELKSFQLPLLRPMEILGFPEHTD